MKSIEKKHLIVKLKPQLKELELGNCFGGTFDFGSGKSTCMCSGENRERHGSFQKRANIALSNMISIVEKFTGKEVYKTFGTYSDTYFCDTKTKEIIIGIDRCGKEITGRRSYY